MEAQRSGLKPLSPAASLILGLCLDLLIWVPVAVLEGNFSIVAIHVLCVVVGLACVLACGKEILNIFFTALLVRNLFTVLGWYSTTESNRQFFLGTNEDSARFWDAAPLGYDQAAAAFEDPLFPRLNVFVHQLSELLAEPAYLANTQIVQMAGVLMVVFAYLLLQQLYGTKVARLAGYLMALHPIMITFSTGLMRDALIGMFGFVLLYAISRLPTAREWISRIWIVLAVVACGLALAFLRSISLAGFALAGVLLLMSRAPYQPKTLSRRAKIVLSVCLVGLVAFAVVDRFDRFENILLHAILARAGEGGQGTELNPDGITTRIAEASPLLFALVAPVGLLQPLPFYAWDAPDFLGGPPAIMDIVLGLGGLTNQILFGFYIIAASYWIRTRDSFGISLGLLFTLGTCTMALIGLGQLRMIMAHCYPFFIAGVAIAILQALQGSWRRMATALGIWLSSLVALYLAYIIYRNFHAAAASAPLLILAAFGSLRLWFYARMPRLSSGSGSHLHKLQQSLLG